MWTRLRALLAQVQARCNEWLDRRSGMWIAGRATRWWRHWLHSLWVRAVLGAALAVLVIAMVMLPLGVPFSFAAHPTGHALPGHHWQATPANIQAESQWFQLSHFGKTLPAPNARITALRQAAKLPSTALGSAAGQWVPLGPEPIDTRNCGTYCQNWSYNSGRVTALAVNPTNSQEGWLGSADGGLWHSLDGGATWTPLTDGQPTLAIGAIAVDPSNPSTIYVGTGEANGNIDGYWGAGLLKSTDDGQTWTLLGATQFSGLGIARIAVDPDPNNSSTLLVAATYDGSLTNPSQLSTLARMGVWRSTDGGSTWSLVLADPPATPYDGGTDVVFDPNQPTHAFAGLGNVFLQGTGVFNSMAGVYESTDSGAHWTQYTAGIPTGNPVERVSLALSPQTTPLYAVLTDAGSGAGGTTFGNLLNNAIYTSSDATNWSAITADSTMASDGGEHQWWYESAIAADPTVSTGQTLYVGGADLWQTTNGGTTWTNYTHAYGGTTGVHPDQHAIAFFSKTSSQFYLGNDGGIWSGNSTQAVTNLNRNLNITQFYRGGIGEVGSHAQLYGGAQDNGESQYPGVATPTIATWQQAVGGDGGTTVVDPTNNAIVYAENLGITPTIQQSTDGGHTWNTIFTVPGGNTANWVWPLIVSPNNHAELLTGTTQVYRTTNSGSSWTPTAGAVPDAGAKLSALAFAPGADLVIYAGDDNGKVYATTNGGASWTTVTPPNSTGGMVTGLAVDPQNRSLVYATFADFAIGAGQHVFKSTNGGSSWTDISASLPNIPYDSVVVQPNFNFQNSQSPAVVGSDAGVFISTNQGGGWDQLGSGLPNAAINQVFTNPTGTKVFVATHGRGMWEYTTSEPAAAYAGSGNFLYAYNPTTGTQLWRYLAPSTVGSPAVGNGLVYFGAGNTLDALNTATGAPVWSYQAGGDVIYNSVVPVVSNNLVYVDASDGYIYALNATTGALVWKTNVGDDNPLALGGGLLFASGSPSNTNLTALDPSTGAIQWSDAFGDTQVSAPVYANGNVFLTVHVPGCYQEPCEYFKAFQATTGYEEWAIGGDGIGTPTVANGVVYAPEGGNLVAYDENTGAQLWSYTVFTTTSITTTPEIANGVVYVGDLQTAVDAVRISDRSIEWRHALSGTAFTSSPVVVNGLVYFGGSDNYFYALDANTGITSWRFQTNAVFASTVAVASSHLVIGPSAIIARAAPGNNPASQTLTITNTGSVTLEWRLSSPLPSWLSLSVGGIGITGIAPGPGISQQVTLNFTMPASPQTYTTTLDFVSTLADNAPIQIPVTVVIGSVQTLYVSSANGLSALDPTTGTQLWRYLAPTTVGSPALGNGLVYFSAGTTLYALDAITGAMAWSYLDGGGSTVPLVSGTLVYASASNGYVYALNAITGTLVWDTNVGGAISSSLALGDGLLFASGSPFYTGYLTALNPATGAVQWSNTFSNFAVSTPVYADGNVFVTTSMWNCNFVPCDHFYAFQATTGYSEWRNNDGPGTVTVANGVIYAPLGGTLVGYDENTGAQLWSYTVSNTASLNTTPVIASSVVYVTTSDGHLTAISVANNTQTQLWQTVVSTSQPSTPVVGAGAVYVAGGDPHVYAVNASSGAEIWSDPLVSGTQLTPVLG